MFPFAKTQKPHESFSLSRECLADLAEDNPHSQGQGNREENKLHHIPAKIPLITIFEKTSEQQRDYHNFPPLFL